MQILIAEDEPISRHILETALKEWGFDFIVTKNGAEAWNVLQQDGSPNIVILDWMMPGMDGIEICRKLRERNSANYTYIILLTSRSRPEDVIRGLDSGADDYIVKPFHPEELKSRIKIGQRIIELEQRISSLARTDYLTGLLNRRAFIERLEAELNKGIRKAGNIGLIITDIDNFKLVNDTYGHQAGDQVLQDFAQSLKKSCRGYDFVGRYGGEEFIIAMPEADLEMTALTAERIRKQIEQNDTFLKDFPVRVKVTASFGITAMEKGAPNTTDTLISAADNALYLAKRSGRNQVIRSTEL
ncbi:MAG TPA: diguanylate cyclase [Syntrophomonadaceae bacterium]|nr:diguanylate cyclase [Syntrophomonadaceae bacterium]